VIPERTDDVSAAPRGAPQQRRSRNAQTAQDLRAVLFRSPLGAPLQAIQLLGGQRPVLESQKIELVAAAHGTLRQIGFVAEGLLGRRYHVK
jgi:hypothetical protein